MYSFLSSVSPDVAAGTLTLTVKPTNILVETGGKGQEIVENDAGDETVFTYSNVTKFYVTLQWDVISSTDAATIFNAYHTVALANGMARSFKWTHPTDGHSYTVKFASELSRTIHPTGRNSIAQVKFRVLGNA